MLARPSSGLAGSQQSLPQCGLHSVTLACMFLTCALMLARCMLTIDSNTRVGRSARQNCQLPNVQQSLYCVVCVLMDRAKVKFYQQSLHYMVRVLVDRARVKTYQQSLHSVVCVLTDRASVKRCIGLVCLAH